MKKYFKRLFISLLGISHLADTCSTKHNLIETVHAYNEIYSGEYLSNTNPVGVLGAGCSP
jgi:hypothetical protein